MWSYTSRVLVKEVTTLQTHLITIVMKQTESPNLFASFSHLIVIKILKYWETSDTFEKLLWKFFSTDLSSFLFHVSFLFYFSLIFLHWFKEFYSSKELWLTFILMISFLSHGLVMEARACEDSMPVIDQVGHKRQLSCLPGHWTFQSFTSRFTLYSIIFIFSHFVHLVLLLIVSCYVFVLSLWLVYIHNILLPAFLPFLLLNLLFFFSQGYLGASPNCSH